VVPSAVVQCVIVKFLTNDNMKPYILMRLRAHSSVMKSFQGPRRMTGGSHVRKAEESFKTCGDTPSAGKVTARVFWDSQGDFF